MQQKLSSSVGILNVYIFFETLRLVGPGTTGKGRTTLQKSTYISLCEEEEPFSIIFADFSL